MTTNIGPTAATGSTRRSRTFTVPSLRIPRIRRDNFHGGKFVVVIVVAVLSAYAGYMGWVTLPSIRELGGPVMLLVILAVFALLVWAVNTDSMVFRTVALFAALVGGMIIGAQKEGLSNSFAGFTVSDWLGFFVGLVILLAIAAWVSHKDVRVISTI